MSAARLLPRIEAHERRRLALASAAFVCVAAGALVARTAGDALFLSLFGSGLLPFLYVAGSLAAAAAAVACVAASRRLSTGQVAMGAGGALLLLDVVLRASFRGYPALACAGAYLAADVAVRIPVLLFWAFASEIFDPGESRRLFGMVGAAGTAACLPAGFLAGPFARWAGTESLLLVAAALAAGFVLFSWLLVREERTRKRPAAREGLAPAGSARNLRASRLFTAIAALSVVTALVETLIDYQFKTAVSSTSSEALASLFGAVYGAANVVALALQLLVVHRLLGGAGVLATLCFLPAGLLAPLAGVVRFGAAGWATAAKTLDVVLANSVNGAARQLLYRGILRESRLTARALAEGLCQPLAVGLAGAGLALSSGAVGIRTAAAVAAGGCLLWILSVFRAHGAYVSGLLDSLKARRLASPGASLLSSEPAVGAWLRETLACAPDEDVIHLTSVLPEAVRLVDPSVIRGALARESPAVTVALLAALRRGGAPRAGELARPFFRHADAEVRRAALHAAASSAGERAALEEALHDPDPRVRATAAAGLAGALDVHARGRGFAALGELIESADPALRAAAAESLEEIETPTPVHRKGRVRLAVRLLSDPEEAVVLPALEALRTRPDAALTLPVLWLLARPRLAGAAAEALVALGPAIVEPLVFFLENGGPAGCEAAVTRIPEILERIGDPRALAAVRKVPFPRSPEERAPVYRAYARLARSAGLPARDAERIDRLVLSECEAAAARLAALRGLGGGPAVALLRRAVTDLYDAHVENAFALLEGRVVEVQMEVLHSRITREEGEARAQTLELLHNVLPSSVRAPLLAVVEGREPDGGTAPPGRGIPALLLDRESEWIAAGAAWAVAEIPLGGCEELLVTLRGDESSLVRETASFALGRLGWTG